MEDADCRALDALLGKIMRTGRLLYTLQGQQAEAPPVRGAAVTRRVQAAQLPGAGNA